MPGDPTITTQDVFQFEYWITTLAGESASGIFG